MKIILKKSISLLLTAVFFAVLCSCSAGEQTSEKALAETEAQTTAEPTTLSLEQQTEQKLDF